MKALYNINTGDIYAIVEDDVNVGFRYKDYPSEIMDNLMELPCDNELIYQGNIIKYKIINGKIVERPKIEVSDIQQYGRVLTEEERLSILLQPSKEETQKAENTIEILSTLQEVGLI